jgi:hypothetical protein
MDDTVVSIAFDVIYILQIKDFRWSKDFLGAGEVWVNTHSTVPVHCHNYAVSDSKR